MIETHVDRARAAVERERDALAAERAAYERFQRRVAGLSTTEARAGVGAGSGGTTPGAVTARTGGADTGDAACEAVREAFAETVRPHSVADRSGEESLLETIREELGDGVAVALAPATDPGFTPRTKEAVISAAHERRRGIDATTDALDSESASLRGAAEAVETITDWLVDADETRLSSLSFEALHTRHDRLATFRERCDQQLQARQELLTETTGRNPGADVGHRALVRYLYQPLPVVYPVLSTFTRLYAVLEDCQRAVRDHLTRRV